MKSVLTIAVGKEVYINMAIALAQSFLLWNKDNGIEFILVTDRLDLVKESPVYNLITVTEINTEDYDNGFAIKLHLDKFLLTEKTLFIDCDCLVYRDLSFVFDKFNNHSVSVIGNTHTEGDFFGDIASVIKRFNLKYLPKFVGAIYYIEKGSLVNDIFNFARSIKPMYDDIGLLRLRNKENEEPLLAISMAKYNQVPISDDGTVKADRMFYKNLSSNVLAGESRLWTKKNPPYPTYCLLLESKPAITHFAASHAEGFEYYSELVRMKLYYYKLPKLLINMLVNFWIVYSGQLKEWVKETLRPLFRVLFGTRKIKQSQR